MDLTPTVPAARQVIERYGPSGFRVSGVIWRGPVLVFPDETLPWTVVAEAAAAAGPSLENLMPVVAHGGVQILLLGLGSRMSAVATDLRASLREHGIALEAMDTGAACRTYNVLAAEDRRVAAALLPPL
jgi:uncharacterized protein